jgi:hypothetical protein
MRAWSTPSGDAVGLYHYPIAPDLPQSADQIADLRRHYRGLVEGAGLGVIAIERVEIAAASWVRTIFKAPQDPKGRTYIGSLTLPLRDFSYVVKVQAAELGVTGLRDTIVFSKLLSSGVVVMGPEGAEGWLVDPYEPGLVGPMTRNRSEVEEYDSEFPDHPLSRARATLRHVASTLRVSDGVRSAPPHRP